MLAFSNDYYGFIFRATQSVELFCAYVCFDYYKQTKGISVIIGTFRKDIAGYTTKRNSRDKKTQKKIMNIIGIQFNERQICVSQKNCIKSTKLVYNEKEEVI